MLEPFLRQAPPTLRPAPGRGVEEPDFYAKLSAGDKEAEAIVRKLFLEVRRGALDGRETIEKGWWQKLLYVAGRQWIYYNPRSGWQDKRMAKWIPRPVTNICAETIDTIRSMQAAIENGAKITPNGPDPINATTAQVADALEPAIADEHEIQERFHEADFWANTLGCVFLHPMWDRDSDANKEFIQAMMCPTCGPQTLAHPLDIEDGQFPGCEKCGAPGEEFMPAVDEEGEQIGELEVIGGGVTDVVSPLELLIPMHYQRWKDVDRLIYLRWRPKSYYAGRPYEAQVQFRSAPGDRALQMFRAMATLSDLSTMNLTTMGQASEGSSEGTVEAELWVKPCASYPEGLWCRAVGGNNGDTFIIRDEEHGVMPGPLPTKTNKGVPMWPWMYYAYNTRGGRLFGPGALDNVLQKQDAINRHDSMVELIFQRMANPIWLEPKGAEVQRFTGEPGLIVRYGVVAGSNAKPERMEGITPNAAFFQVREQYFIDAERASGTQDVLKGATPSGVEAFSALNLLVERSQSRFSAMFKNRGRAYRAWLKVAIELERVHGPQSRTRATIGTNNTYTFKEFKRKDLQGAIDIKVEDGTDTPKTSLGKRAAVQQAQQLGLIDTTQPDQVFEGLQLLGIANMSPSLDRQTVAAQVEHHKYELWVAGQRQGPNPLKVESWQNHRVHIKQFDIWANSDRIRDLTLRDPLVQAELTFHRLQHSVADLNPFGLPIPPGMAAIDPATGQPTMPGAMPAGPGGPPAPGGPGAPPGAQGAAMAGPNSLQESGAPDTVPGAAPGGGNMAQPA